MKNNISQIKVLNISQKLPDEVDVKNYDDYVFGYLEAKADALEALKTPECITSHPVENDICVVCGKDFRIIK